MSSTEWTVLHLVTLARLDPHHLLRLNLGLPETFEADFHDPRLARTATLLLPAVRTVLELVLADTFALAPLDASFLLVLPRRSTRVLATSLRNTFTNYR